MPEKERKRHRRHTTWLQVFVSMQGVATVGGVGDGNPNTPSTKEIVVTTPSPLPAQPSFELRVHKSPFRDTFSLSAAANGADSFVLKVQRTDAPHGWGQNLQVWWSVTGMVEEYKFAEGLKKRRELRRKTREEKKEGREERGKGEKREKSEKRMKRYEEEKREERERVCMFVINERAYVLGVALVGFSGDGGPYSPITKAIQIQLSRDLPSQQQLRLECSPYKSPYQDRFEFAMRVLGSRTIEISTTRVDVKQGWGQNLQVRWALIGNGLGFFFLEKSRKKQKKEKKRGNICCF